MASLCYFFYHLSSLIFRNHLLERMRWILVSKRQASETNPWQAGYAECDITPKPGQSFMAGYGIERSSRGVLAPLKAQALVIADRRGRKVVLLAADVIGFDRTSVNALRNAIQKLHRLPADRVMFTASHTHWGPAISYGMNFICGAPNPWYMMYFERQLLKVTAQAIERLASAKITYGSIDTRIGHNRRPFDENSKPIKSGVPNLKGPYDEHTPVLEIIRRRSPRRIVIVGHACHPTDSGFVPKWWPAYPGVMRSTLEKSLGSSTRALFVMGCGGDAKVTIRHPKTGRWAFSFTPAGARIAGKRLATAVLSHLQEGDRCSISGSLQCALVSGALTYGQGPSRRQIEDLAVDAEAYAGDVFWARQMQAYPQQARSCRFDVQAWRFGRHLTLFALEGETCSDLGPLTRSVARTDEAMVIGFANTNVGYVPTRRIVREGGYEGESSHRVYFHPAPYTEKVEQEFAKVVKRAITKLGAG